MSNITETKNMRPPIQLLGAPAPSKMYSSSARIGQKPLVLLARLLLEPRPTTRESILTFLWPEASEERARGSLRQALHVLRDALGDDFLDADRYAITVARAPKVDLLDFLQAVRQGNSHQAALLYRGTLLEGVALDDAMDAELWLDLERRRLAKLFEQMATSVFEESKIATSSHERLTVALKLRDTTPSAVRHWRFLFETLTALQASEQLQFERAALGARIELRQIDNPDAAIGLLR